MSGIEAEFIRKRFIPLDKARKYFVNLKTKLSRYEYSYYGCDVYKIEYYDGRAHRVFCDRQAKYEVVLLKGGVAYLSYLCSVHARYFKSKNEYKM